METMQSDVIVITYFICKNHNRECYAYEPITNLITTIIMIVRMKLILATILLIMMIVVSLK